MLVPLTFRHRIGLLVALAAAALIAVAAVALVLGRRGEQQLAGIETRYVPLIELDRDLETQFTQIARALKDAADAAEDSRLRDAEVLYRDMVERLRAGRQALADNGGDADALEVALTAYYRRARGVAAALVAGTPAAQLGDEAEALVREHSALATMLDHAATPDRRRLAAAFASARASLRDALWIDIAVASAALVLIGLWSWRLIRHTVGTLRAVAAGVERIAHGDLGHEIEVTTSDELGDLAREANQTAARLREYRDGAQRHEAELREAYATLEARNATLVGAQQLLEERAADLARASRYKSEFLANMSHELRTPLNSILILSKVLADNQGVDGGRGAMTGKQVEFAQLIHRSGEELLALINEVLDLAKVEAGKQTIECAPLALAALEDYVRRMFEPLAVQKGLAFGVEVTADVPVAIRTDWTRVAQILKNLIANAFKFTEHGRVSVRVSRELSGGGASPIDDPVVIAVSDTGIGIAADKQAWIFEAFAQAETGISRKFGGTGLGLTIAKQLAVRLGGDLVVASTLGEGSTFSLILPSAGPPVEAPPRPVDAAAQSLVDRNRPTEPPRLARASDALEPEPALDGKTVLLVDDDMRNVYSLSSALRARRIEVITATDGHEALDELQRNPALDLVLIDMMMPRTDGSEAIRQIRSQARFAELPIIALDARMLPGDREDCLAAGASDYVSKPVDIGHLLGLLRSWLTRPG